MNRDYSAYITLAEFVARDVGNRLRSVIADPQSIEINTKGDSTDLVTEFDVWAEKEITSRILKAFPAHNTLGEESVGLNKDRKMLKKRGSDGIVWCIDPIDGTTNFANGIPQIGISIAVLDNGLPRVGVVYDPCRDEMFSASEAAGATLNGKTISTSSKTDLGNAVIATGFPYDKKDAWVDIRDVFEAFLSRSRGVRRFGAATLDACWVACGRFDGFFEYGLAPWDVAAAAVIVKEAGGRIGNFDTATDGDFSVFAGTFLFANANIYDSMRSTIANVRH